MNSTVYNRKNKFLIPIILILLIPTVLAVYFSMNPGSEGSIPMNISEIKVEFSNLNLSESFTDKKDIEIYQNAVLYAEKIDENYRDVTNETPFVVTFVMPDSQEPMVYNFFMKFDSDECIYKNSIGEYYLFREEYALKLLERAEFQSINKIATAPYAFAGYNLANLAPTSGEWSHRNADGEFAVETIDGSSAAYNTVPAKISMTNLGSLSFGAATNPDSVNVKVSHNGAVKHDGDFDNLINANIMSASDTYYDMVITATWNEKDGVDYYGTLVYNAKLFYDVSPTYTAVFNGSIIRGDFGIIKIQNFNDGDKLFVSSDFTLPSELQVFRSPMGYSFAFVPVEYWTPGEVGTYNVTLSIADGASQTIKIKVKDVQTIKPAIASQQMLIGDIDLASCFTEEAFKQFDDIVIAKTAATDRNMLWEGKFVYPCAENKKNRGNGMADYGTERTINAAGIHNRTYYHNGVDIKMNEGESVLASNNGKVVFAGELTLTGKTVIIDHGCSVLTYYGHLGSINVNEGDVVSKSGVIGTAGNTGFAVSANGASGERAVQVHFAVSLEGKFVTPYYLWYGGIDFDD